MTHAEAVARIRECGLQGPAHGNFKRAKELLDLAPELVDAMNSVDASAVDETPQGAAAHTGSRRILELFLERGVRANVFMEAALGHADAVGQMLRKDHALINAKGAHGIPLIAHAADGATAQVMIDGGVACDVFMAAQLGLAEHLRKLVHRDPELLSLHSPVGLTPLQIARMYQQKEAVRAILALGAQDPEGAGAYFLEGGSKLVSKQAARSNGNVELGWEKRAMAAKVQTQLVGRTRGDLVVCFQGSSSLKGQLLDVTINDAQGMTLFGKLVEEPVGV